MRRETWEETGIEVGQVIYHSSQPWPGNGLVIFFRYENHQRMLLEVFVMAILILSKIQEYLHSGTNT